MNNKKETELLTAIEQLNPLLKAAGFCEFRVVNPKECRAQEQNARYMPSEVFNQLVENIKSDKRLEGMPLCYEDENKVIRIISGHHRIKAAEEAGLTQIIVMLAEPASKDEIVSQQLSHNALSGKDDAQVLNDLFNSIKDIGLRIASGLDDTLSNIAYVSLNFKVGGFKELVLAFVEEDILLIDEKMENFAKDSSIKTSDTVRVVPLELYDKFGTILRKVKKNENIKSSSVGFMRMVEMAELYLKQNHVQSGKEIKSP